LALDKVKTKSDLLNFKDKSGQFIHSQFDPIKESHRLISSLPVSNSNHTLVVWGFGAGHLTQAIYDSNLSFNTIVCIEPEESIFEDSDIKKNFKIWKNSF
jgi:hypothetical protein